MTRAVVQLIPGAPPIVNGVGDYAITVARALRKDWRIDSTFLVCHQEWDGPEYFENFRFIAHRSRRSDDLYEVLLRACVADASPVTLVLQLSPYGFDINGSPFWLLQALRRWKQVDPANRRLITYFHELYATSAPWRRGFWVSPMQRYCTRRIAGLTDGAITSKDLYAERLEAWVPAGGRRVVTLPVVSNIGEPPNLRPIGSRTRRLLIWGSAQAKDAVYVRHHDELASAVKSLEVTQIAEAGPPARHAPQRIAGIPVATLGVMPSDALSELMSDTFAAAISYDPDYLAKSTLYAACCAHGVPFVHFSDDPPKADGMDGIRRGVHYIGMEELQTTSPEWENRLQQVAAAAAAWYAPHAAGQHARQLAQALDGALPAPANRDHWRH